MVSHGVGYADVYKSIWLIVDAINMCPEFKISFPTSHANQSEIAAGFAAKSAVGFDNCAGAVNGVLIWTKKPSKHVLDEAGLGAKKFFCG